MSKVLFTASVFEHLAGFHVPYMQYFRDRGFEVHTAASGENTVSCVSRHYDVGFERSPFSPKNIRAYKALKKLIAENGYDIIHCHTPVVSVLTRLAARNARKAGTVVLYTCHGFHFYRGARNFQSKLFRVVEKRLCRYTDHLITINTEDYEALDRYGFKPGAAYRVHGVGVDASRFTPQTEEGKSACRAALGIAPEAFVLIFGGEYSPNKNQQMLIKTVELLKRSIPGLLLLLPGEGSMRAEYETTLRSLKLEEHVRLLGFRRDMDKLLLAADIAVSSSMREGLGINLVEAMAVGLPVVATCIRGHTDLIEDGVNGFLVEPDDEKAMAQKILFLHGHPDLMADMSAKQPEMVKPFLLQNAKAEMTGIYEMIMRQKEQFANRQ